jgi:hypothetical protein
VSLLRPERLKIFFSPQRLALVKTVGRIRKRVVGKQAWTVPLPGGRPWEASLALLAQVLQEAQWKADSAEMLLSNRMVRYTLVPWSDALSGRQERQAFLQHCFQTAYGDISRQWDLRMDMPLPGESVLASGVESALLESLHAVLGKAGIRLDGVYPLFMVQANQSRHWLQRGSTWFVAIEHDGLCLALLENGLWKTVGFHEMGSVETPHLSGHLQALFARESALLGLADKDWPVVLHWPKAGASPVLPGRNVTRVGITMPAGSMPANDISLLWLTGGT